MREVPLVDRGERILPRSKSRCREGIKVPNLIDKIEERGHEELANALTAPVYEVSSIVSPITGKVRSVVEIIAACREMGEVSVVDHGNDDGGNGHMVDSRHCQKKLF